MGTRLNRDAYQRLIDEDLAWLDKQPRSLEREHIKDIVRLSPQREYSNTTTPPDFTEHVHCWHERVDAASFCCGCEDLTYLHQAVQMNLTEQARQLVEQWLNEPSVRTFIRFTKNDQQSELLLNAIASALTEAATQGQATSRKFTEGSTEDFSDPAGRLIKELNRKRKAHLMGDCAGDACPDWIDEQIKVIATFASEVAKYSQIDGQAVGIERALRAASDGNNIRMVGGSTGDAVGTARLIQQAIRALSPDPSFLNRVRNEAATAALEQERNRVRGLVETMLYSDSFVSAIWAGTKAVKTQIESLIAAIGGDKEQDQG